MTFGDLFVPPPRRWGLRGDSHLWEAMRVRFAWWYEVGLALVLDRWNVAGGSRS